MESKTEFNYKTDKEARIWKSEQKMSSVPAHFLNTPKYQENLPFPTCPMNSG